jgi:PAS domain S-box-containing protein
LQAETDFRRLFESAPELFIVLRPDFTIVAVSDAYLKTAMTLRKKILGEAFFEVFPDNPQDPRATGMRELRASLEKVLQTRKPDTMAARKYDIPRPESEGGGFEVRYWSSVNTPLLNSKGEVECIIRQVEDITTMVCNEGERKVIEQERDLFFTYSFDLLGIVGTDGYFKRLNPAFEKALGYTEEELCARPIAEFLHPEDVAKTKRGIQTLASGSPTIASMNRYRCKDGTYKWFSWNTTPMGPLLYSIGRDITEQVQAEERIRQLNLELERKNEELEQKVQDRLTDLRRSEDQVQQLQKMDAIGRLAGGIAHDFNNMLGAISLYCEVLADLSGDPASVQKHVQDILRVVGSGAALTRQLLIFSRKQIVQLQTVQLNPLIKQLENMLNRLIGEHIKIVTKLSEDLRAISVDPSQMEQVILNLVVNARDAMPQGGNITLETSNIYLDESFTSTHLSVNPGHYVLLAISDDGTGMDAETVAKIFEPFFTTKPVGKGTGLGLTTTYGIIKQCKGTIWVYSEPGHGTVFKIYLPVAENIKIEPEMPSSVVSDLSGTETILLVEDDENLRVGFTMMLRKKGYKVLEAANGKEAMDVCENYAETIHLLLTDMVMPGFSGFVLAQKAIILREDLRVLYMSGYTNDALENSGVDSLSQLDFIQKPFGTNALMVKVREVLSQNPRR